MKKILAFVYLLLFFSLYVPAQELDLKGVLDFSVPSGGVSGKAIHLKADSVVVDLSEFGIGVANNGGGSDGKEYVLPPLTVQPGADILLVRDSQAMADYLVECFKEFEVVIMVGKTVLDFNGDDAIELYRDSNAIATFGDPLVDGTGKSWEYTDAWAYKADTNWEVAKVNCTDNTANIYYSDCIYPGCPDIKVARVDVVARDSVILKDGGVLRMKARVYPPYARDTGVLWSVTDSSVARIDSTGIVTALDNGCVTVVAKAVDGSGVAGAMKLKIKGQVLSVEVLEGGAVLYPNPASRHFQIQPVAGVEYIRIYDGSSRCVRRVETNFGKVDVSDLRSGIYSAVVYHNGYTEHHRLIIYGE